MWINCPSNVQGIKSFPIVPAVLIENTISMESSVDAFELLLKAEVACRSAHCSEPHSWSD